jgi:hypothetical protein
MTQRRVLAGGRSATVSGLPSGPITYLARDVKCSLIVFLNPVLHKRDMMHGIGFGLIFFYSRFGK